MTGVQTCALPIYDIQSTDAIWFGKISGTQDEANFGGSREETLDVEEIGRASCRERV